MTSSTSDYASKTFPKNSGNARKLVFAAALLGVFAFAAYMRFRGIDSRPMHCDEAVQAYKVGEMLAGEIYRYDPTDFHGPALYFFAFWLSKIFGIASFAELSETFLRGVPATIGALGCVAIPLAFFGRRPVPVFISGTLLAAAAPAVFYSAYFIQETLLVVFAWTSAGIFFFRKKTLGNAVFAGALAGLAVASKETWILAAFAFLVANVSENAFSPARGREIFAGKFARVFARVFARIAVFLASAGIVGALFYSSFGKNPHGLADFFSAFPHYVAKAKISETFPGGNAESPQAFSQIFPAALCGILLCAVAGFLASRILSRTWKFIEKISARTFPSALQSVAIFSGASAIALGIVHLKMEYCTPWLFLGIVPGIALAVAGFATIFFRGKPRLALAGALTIFVAWAVFFRPEENRIFRFEHTGERVSEIAKTVANARTEFVANGGNEADFFVAVLADEYWPLPWYLRRERVGYFGEKFANAPPANAPFVIADFGFENENFCPIFEFELRPGVILSAQRRR